MFLIKIVSKMYNSNNTVSVKVFFTKILVVTCLFALASCSDGFRRTMGLKRSAPDEFKVVSNQPLVVPPDFSLRPPAPGARSPFEADLSDQAKDLVYKPQSDKSFTTKEKNYLGQAAARSDDDFRQRLGLDDANPNIKQELDAEDIKSAEIEQDKGFFSKVSSYLSSDQKAEPVVAAASEKDRIKENLEQGKPVNEGEVKEQKSGGKSGLLNRIFNW